MTGLNKLTYSLITFCVALLLMLSACNSSSKNRPDVSGIKINYTSYRFDKDLYALDTAHLAAGLQSLKSKYPTFLDYFLDTLMAYGINGNYSDTTAGVSQGLLPFLTFPDFKQLEDSIQAHYPTTTDIDKQLEDGFVLLKYYLPKVPTPKIYYLNLGLSKWSAFPIDDNNLCIGLDMFLGAQYPNYQAVGIPAYVLSHHTSEYIPVAVFSSIYWGMHPFKTEEKNLLELMIDRGREQYFLHQILPDIADSVLFGYAGRQIDWCEHNEALIYNFFIQQKILYSTVAQNIMPYVTDGPFARGLENTVNPVKQTPGSVGTWLGYRIVCSYMEHNSGTTLDELLQMKVSPLQFLEAAQYKPR